MQLKSIANSLGVNKKRNPAAASLLDFLHNSRNETEMFQPDTEFVDSRWIGMLITAYGPKRGPLKSKIH